MRLRTRPHHFENAYQGRPPWDIGYPQPALARLVDGGAIRGRVLDVGCGTGELTLHMAAHGLDALGIDLIPAAVERAEAKARERGLAAEFRVHDALRLEGLGQAFDAVVDSGLFHVFTDEDRVRFADSLAAVLRPGGDYWMLCFSDKEPTHWGGPRRVSEAEIRATFQDGWEVVSVEPARFDVTMPDVGGHALLAHLRRVE